MVVFDSHTTLIEGCSFWNIDDKHEKLFHLEEDFEHFMFESVTNILGITKITADDEVGDNFITIIKYLRCGSIKTTRLDTKEIYGITRKEFFEQWNWWKEITDGSYIHFYRGTVTTEDVSLIPKQPKYNKSF